MTECTESKPIAVTPASIRTSGLAPAAERPALRKQALDLLTADLAAIRKLPATDRAFAHETLDHRLVDEDFVSVREPRALERLPSAEREAWGKLWADVRELRDRTALRPVK